MLDDLKFIHQRDGQDALGIAEKQYQQLLHVFDIDGWNLSSENCQNIVLGGMGGSALAALIARNWPGAKVPFEVSRQYHIPEYMGENTLFIASSYSGNTEEALSSLAEAEVRKARVVVMAQGGQLAEIAGSRHYPLLRLPDTAQPRYSVFSQLKAITVLLESTGLTPQYAAVNELEKTSKFLEQAVQAWLPTVPIKQNLAKKLALELAGKSPAIYGGPLMAPAAYKWKINFNENAKNVAWWNELPEFDHNELIGWSSHPINKPYGIIELRSKLEHERVQKRFTVGERVLSGLRPSPNVVEVHGETLVEQLLWAVNFGDFVSIYLALLNNINPVPVELVEKFKKSLDN